MQENTIPASPEKSRKVQILLTIEYEGNTDENLAETMDQAMLATINVSNLLQGCDNIDAKVLDYSMKIDEIPEDPVLIHEKPSSGGNDYILNENATSVWVQVDNQVVYIRRTDDPGLAVDVMSVGDEDGTSLGSIVVGADTESADVSAAQDVIELQPISFSSGEKSVSDDDLCSECHHCTYRPGEMSRCDLSWPGLEDKNGYVRACAHLLK